MQGLGSYRWAQFSLDLKVRGGKVDCKFGSKYYKWWMIQKASRVH